MGDASAPEANDPRSLVHQEWKEIQKLFTGLSWADKRKKSCGGDRRISQVYARLKRLSERIAKRAGEPHEAADGLLEVVLGGRDMFLPLGKDYVGSADALKVALDTIAANDLIDRRLVDKIAGLRLEATCKTLTWTHGAESGLTVNGPAHALAHVLSGRVESLAELSGDGVEIMRAALCDDSWRWDDIHGWKVNPLSGFDRITGRGKRKWRAEAWPKSRGMKAVRAVVRDDAPTAAYPTEGSQQTVLLAMYGEAMNSWRQLTDVRFRLMSMLPAVSIIAFVPLLVLATQDPEWPALVGGITLATLGLTLTHGLHIYEQRNDGLYDDLISRARRIEHELGVVNGIMKGRVKAPNKRISHGRGLRWVFASVKYAWIVVIAVLTIVLIQSRGGDANDGLVDDPIKVQLVEPELAPPEG